MAMLQALGYQVRILEFPAIVVHEKHRGGLKERELKGYNATNWRYWVDRNQRCELNPNTENWGEVHTGFEEVEFRFGIRQNATLAYGHQLTDFKGEKPSLPRHMIRMPFC